MASVPAAGLFQRNTFVCTSCLRHSRPLCGVRPSRVRSLGTASCSSRGIAPRCSPKIPFPDAQRAINPRASSPLRLNLSYRQYSTPASSTKAATSGLVSVSSRRLVALSGPDAAKFLQGLVTNNVDPARQTPFYSAFLDARGRVLWDVFIWVYPELVAKEGAWSCYIEVDINEIEALVKHLKRHKLRSKVNINVVEESEMGVWAAWGTSPEQLQSEHLVASLIDPRAAGFGTRCLFEANRAPTSMSVQTAELLQYQLRRYLYGIAEGPHEIARESALPMECNIDLNQGIDFKKGCYVGQELTIRTKHTGVVRKRILPVQLYHADKTPPSDSLTFDSEWLTTTLPESGMDIKQLDDNGSIKKGRAAGKFITSVGNIGLALCRLEMMTSMRVSAEGGSWKPGVEFGMEWPSEGEVVRVKAVVPQWFRERERDVWDKNRTRV